MSVLGRALEELAEQPSEGSLETFRKHLDSRWIEDALRAHGTATLRRRRLPAEQVVWLVLGMAMMRDRPISEVVSRLDLALPARNGSAEVATSSIVQARQRVGAEPLETLFNQCAQKWAHADADARRWRGLALYGVDGTVLRVADSEENRKYFGLRNGGKRGPSGYPLVRLAALMSLRSHLLARAAFGPWLTSELKLSESLWPHIPDHSLTILDRNFLAAQVLVGLQSGGEKRHWLTRAKTSTKWGVLKRFSAGDLLVELTVSHDARRKNPKLPKTFTARAVSYRHPRSKGTQWLLTSLCEPSNAPAQELVSLYRERWELELGFDEIKTHLLQREETIRSRKPEGVEQELWGILTAYNLIRVEMTAIADEAEVAPQRISFTVAMRFIRDEWMWCAGASPGAIPKNLRRMRERIRSFLLPQRRSERLFPRAVKLKMSNYPRKRRDPQPADA